MLGAGHGCGMASVNQTWPHCVNQMGKTHSEPLAAQHGRGKAWPRHAMCESSLSLPSHPPPNHHSHLADAWRHFVNFIVNAVRQVNATVPFKNMMLLYITFAQK